MTFLTMPAHRAESASIVVYDHDHDNAVLWDAIRADDGKPFLAEHGELVSAAAVR